MTALRSAGWLVLGLLGGASLVVQAALNAGLRARIHSVWWAGCISYVGGTLAMVCAVALSWQALPGTSLRATPGLWWLGGLFGAAYLAISIVLVPRVGAASVVTLVVAGQLLASLLIDQHGLLGVPRHPFTPTRALAAALVLAGVLLARR